MSKIPTLPPNILTCKYCTPTQAGRQLDNHFELRIMHRRYITTYSGTMQMSSPILSLKSNLIHCCCHENRDCEVPLPRQEGRHATQQADSTSSWLTSRPIPEEMPVLVTGSLYCTRYLCLSSTLCSVWLRVLERVLTETDDSVCVCVCVCVCVAQCVTTVVWHQPNRCDFCLQPENWPSDLSFVVHSYKCRLFFFCLQ